MKCANKNCYCNWTACADFGTAVARHPRAATQWYRLFLLAEYGVATVHVLLCIVNKDDSAVFCFFVFGNLDL